MRPVIASGATVMLVCGVAVGGSSRG